MPLTEIDDVADYAVGRLRGQGPDEAVAVLAGRIGEAAEGNFLYAYYVVGELLASSALAGLDVPTAADVPLPAGGLAGVYGEFLRRVVGDGPGPLAEHRPADPGTARGRPR